jgi:hypothetical protein
MLPFLISFVPRRKSIMTLAFPEQKLLCIMAAFSIQAASLSPPSAVL